MLQAVPSGTNVGHQPPLMIQAEVAHHSADLSAVARRRTPRIPIPTRFLISASASALPSFAAMPDKRFVYVLKNPDSNPRFYIDLRSRLCEAALWIGIGRAGLPYSLERCPPDNASRAVA